ncbi:MAG: SRPBCC family protein [Kiloniellales bacterium]|nr:SRPBCC family protein [Kiloniellales bacterium]
MPKVVLKSDVAAAPDVLWRAIRDFSALGRWNPLVLSLDSDGDGEGSTRRVELEGAGTFVERLDRRNDGERTYSYSIVESPLPISEGTVEVRVKDNGDGTATVEWTGSFESEALSEFQTVRVFQQLYQAALDNLGHHVLGKKRES